MSGGDGASRWARWRSAMLWPLAIFAASLLVFSAFAWDRLGGPSTDPHFAWQANAFLDGSLELQRPPPHGNDWASWEWMRLRSGQEIEGVWLDRAAGRFRALDGSVFVIDRGELDPTQRKTHHFVSFPPGPAVLMVPLAAIQGYEVNDVAFTVFFAALNVALFYALLRRVAARGRSGRSRREDLLLTALFGFGTVHLWCSVLGQVWFTALVVGVAFTLAYIHCALDARRPLLAGIFLAAAFATRTPLLFSAVLFFGFLLFPKGKLLQRSDWGDAARRLALFAAPCLIVGGLLLWMNQARFGDPFEFGHRYLAGGAIDRIQRYGLFNIHFLSKNLSAALTLLPRFQPDAPYVLISRHGMSILATTPAFALLLWPRLRDDAEDRLWWRLLWITVAAIALPGLLYQNTGYEQFGYRFSLDYTPYLALLLATSRRPLDRTFLALLLVGVLVNAFGAVTFKRFMEFYLPPNQFFE